MWRERWEGKIVEGWNKREHCEGKVVEGTFVEVSL